MDDHVEFFEELRLLVQQGLLEEAAAQLATFLKHRDRALADAALTVQGALKNLVRLQLDGSASTGDVVGVRRAQAGTLLGVIREASQQPLAQRPLHQPLTAPPSAPPVLEKIIGANRLMSVAWLRHGLLASRAVCRIETPNGLGTGFLLKGGLILTNHHVLPAGFVAEKSIAAFNYEEDERGDLLPIHRYRLDAPTFRSDQATDCAVVRIGGGLGDAAPSREWGSLSLSSSAPSVGDFVSIIQHPGGGAKKIAVSENQVVAVLDKHVQYLTDTMPGSSGSPVFDDAWRVVAIHHQGGLLRSDNPLGARMFANQGILISAVKRALLLA